MANWTTIEGANTTVTAGISDDVTGLYVTIVPVSGYSITPQNFVIGGATPNGNTWTGGNVSSIIQSVTFSQSGDNVLATIACNSHVFDSATTIRIDIDESTVHPVEQTVVGVCTDVQYPHPTSNVTQVITTEATPTTVVTGNSGTPWVKNYEHLENNISSLLVFRMVLTPSTGYSIINHTLLYTASIEGGETGFTSAITDTTTGGGKIFSVYYSQPPGGGYYEPCNFGNLFTVDYSEKLISVDPTNGIHTVNVSTLMDHLGGESPITVFGTAGATYTMKVREVASPNKTYNFTTDTMTTSATSYSGTIGADGSESVQFVLASSATNASYDVIIESSGGSTLSPEVPDAIGELRINQYGVNTLTIALESAETNHFGTLPSNLLVYRPIRYTGDSYTDNGIDDFMVKGVTTGSSTKVEVLNLTQIKNLTSSMVVAGEGIPHGTTIVSVARHYIVLSVAVNLTSPTRLICALPGADMVPFSFTIPPYGSRTLTVDTTNKHENSVWGFSNISTTANLAQFGSTNLNVVDSRGILLGMSVTGTGISASTVVSSIDYKAHAVTLNQAHVGVADTARLVFRGSNNTKCKLMNISADIVGSNAVISGHIMVPELDNSAKAIIFLDDILNSVS